MHEILLAVFAFSYLSNMHNINYLTTLRSCTCTLTRNGLPPTCVSCTELCLGILVGTWPCGTVVMVGEFFGAESKAQVYGNVHTFLQKIEESTSNLGAFV